MVHHTNCPLCRSNDIQPFISCKDNLVTGEEFTLFKCPDCSFCFTQDSPEEGLIGEYYESSEYISHSDSSATLIDKLYQVVRKYMLGKKRRLVERACGRHSGDILDIGSGTGHFLNEMKESGWKVTGIEPNNKARSYAVSGFGLEIFTPEKINSLENESFDCVTMWHVLEHFYNPREYLGEVKRILNKSGKVVVALPNCNSADAGFYGEDWAAYDVPRHLWHFNPSTFKQLAEIMGFSIQSVHPLHFDVFYISILSEKNRKSRFAVLNGMFKGMFLAFYSQFSKGKQSSLVYILKRSEG